MIGDCLGPESHPGDVVVVDRSNMTPRLGDTLVVVTDLAEVMVKR